MQNPVSDIQLAENKLSEDCQLFIGPATMAIHAVDAVFEIESDPEKQEELFAECLSGWIQMLVAVMETMRFCAILHECNR